MATGRIDEVVSESSFQQLEKLVSLLGSSQALFTDNIKGAIALNNAIGGTKNFKDFTATTEKAQLAIDKLAISQAKVQQAELKLQQTRDAIAQKYEAQMARQAAMEAKQTARINEAERAYTKLSRELETARKGAQDLAAQYGVTDQRFISAAKNVVKLDDNLKLIDGKLGKYQRNVGNYASGFNGLGNSINQITREFPAFAFSVQTGFLALSNNIPIFFDEISRTRKEIAALRAEGQAVPSLISQIGKSFLSLSTILSIIVSLSVIYGKEIGEFFTALFKGKSAMDQFVIRQESIKTALQDTNYKDAIKNLAQLTVHFQMAKDGLLDKKRVLEEYNETMGKTIGEAETFNEAEAKFIQNTDRYIQVTALRARASAVLATAVSKTIEMQELQEDKSVGVVDRLLSALTQAGTGGLASAGQGGVSGSSAEKVAQERRNARIAALRKEVGLYKAEFEKLSKELGGDALDPIKPKDKKEKIDIFLRDYLELQRLIAQTAADTAQEVATSERATFAERQAGINEFLKQSLLAIDFANKKEKLDKELTADAIKAIDIKSENERIAARKAGAEALRAIQAAELEAYKKKLEDEDKIRITAQGKAISEIEVYRDTTLALLNEMFTEGTIDQKEYEKRRLELQRQFTIDYINQEIKGVEELIQVNKDRGLDTYEQEKELAALRLKLSEVTTQKQIDDLKKLADAEKYLFDLQKQFRQELFNLAVSLVNARFDVEKNAVQENIDQIDIQREKEVEAVANSLATEQEKANRLEVINAQADAKKNALERRQRQIDLQRARFEKAANVARTANATFSNIAQAGIYLSNPITAPLYPGIVALISAIGAAQLAAIIATPIPRFAKGGTQKKDGLAMFGEVGTELMIEPGGKKSLTPDKPTVGFVKAGTRFISHKDLVKMSGGLGDVMYYQGEKIDIEPLIDATEKSGRRIEKAILNNRPKKTGLQYYGSQRGQEYLRKNI